MLSYPKNCAGFRHRPAVGSREAGDGVDAQMAHPAAMPARDPAGSHLYVQHHGWRAPTFKREVRESVAARPGLDFRPAPPGVIGWATRFASFLRRISERQLTLTSEEPTMGDGGLSEQRFWRSCRPVWHGSYGRAHQASGRRRWTASPQRRTCGESGSQVIGAPSATSAGAGVVKDR